MKTLGIVLIFFIILCIWSVMIFGIVSIYRDEKKRSEALRAFAKANGFTFKRKIRKVAELGLPQSELFTQSRNNWPHNAMAGEVEDLEVRVLDYRFKYCTRVNAPIYDQTVVAIKVGEAMLPEFTLARESYYSKKGRKKPDGRDIVIDVLRGFSEEYVLRGEDEGAIRALFNARVIEAYTEQMYCNVEVREGWLFVYRAGQRERPALLQEQFEKAFGFMYELTGATRCEGII